MSYRVKAVLEKKTGRKAVYTGDGYMLQNIYLDQIALKQIFRGKVPDVINFILEVPEEEEAPEDLKLEELKRATDRDLRKNAWRLKKADGEAPEG